MMNLSEYRHRGAHLADYLPWAALVAKGVVLNKDGSFQRTAQFRGPDLDSAVAAELVAVAGRLNNALRRLGRPREAVTTASSPGAKAVSGVFFVSTSLLNTHRCPARRRRSSLFLSVSMGMSMAGTVRQGRDGCKPGRSGAYARVGRLYLRNRS